MELMKNVQAWIEGVQVEYDALQQIRNISTLPILAGHVAVMPDVHLGKGATVGTVIPTRGAIVPSSVGVDIGCGMCAVRTNLRADDLPESLAAVRSSFEAAVPVGFNFHDKAVEPIRFIPHPDGQRAHNRMQELHARFERLAILPALGRLNIQRMWLQLGTLGGGNHFIELSLDEDGSVWLMLHSGSRNVGKTIGEVAIGMAKESAARAHVHLPDADLAWLNEGTAEFNQYVEALQWAQDYAALSRELMLALTLDALREALGRPVDTTEKAVNCHHNYARIEEHFGSKVWITRKGAVSARAGQLGIIPGSMGTHSYIVRGRGNPLSYCSCSHGAGRRMSRGAARREFDLAALASQTAGVECRKDAGVLDEIPGAYKDIDAVMAAQADLVETIHTLKQVLCVKG